ncbi:BglG family transcription antiterminator [uncultured Enterococcus sp.]|uniref:BglG family transcription antiterminator n=1 Tax=uncultured Enterococcus sp. TaxID=167972 RepID=UPI002583B104|nr:BglG family transcription antiterminator [uncultured Enterococcus sp.]
MSKLAYQRLDDLLELLAKQTTPLPMKELAKSFSISERTVRTDIANLNDLLRNVGAAVTLVRGQGYLLTVLSKEQFTAWWQESMTSADSFLTTSEERQAYLLFLLFKNENPLSLDDFLDQLFISKNTFYSYLKTARDNLMTYQLKVINRPNIGFEVLGNEFAKRQAISDLLIEKDLQEYLIGFTEMELALFDTIDLDLLQTLELNDLAPLELLDSDYYHKNILSHFALALSRFLSGHPITEFPLRVPTLKRHAKEALCHFLNEIDRAYDIQLTEGEKDYFTYYLALNAPRLVETESTSKSSTETAQAIVSELLHAIKRTSNFDWLEDKMLVEDLTSHIEGFINMNLMEARRSNPLLETIKKSFPQAYDLCLTHLETLGKKHGLYFSQDEVGYIALHIAGAMERNSISHHRKYRVILVCGTGRAMSRIIEAKIKKHYQETIEVVDRVSYVELQQCDLTTVDFVITTVPLEQLSVPHIYINMATLDKEIGKIEPFIQRFDEANGEIFSLFQEAFYFHGDVENKERLLKKMTQQLVDKGYVPASFHDSIMKREAINQTNINEWLAIPHPMSLLAKQSAVAVAVIPNGVDWGNGDLVKFVFLFAISKEDYEDTEEIYSLILEFMEREEIQQALLQQSDYPHFLTQIKTL